MREDLFDRTRDDVGRRGRSDYRRTQDWRQRYRGRDRQRVADFRNLDPDTGRPLRRPQSPLTRQTRGGVARARARVLEEEVQRVGGNGIALDRTVIEAWGAEFKISDTDGNVLERLVRWDRLRCRDADGTEFELDLDVANRIENITPAP